MTQLVKNVAAGSPLATGGILAAPKGTTAPTDATTALNAAFTAFGYAGQSGLEPSGEGAKKKDILAWGGDIVASVTESKSIRRFKFTLIEVFNPDTLRYVFGDANVTVTAATALTGTKITVQDKGDEPLNKAFVFEMFYQGKRMRYYAPDASSVILAERPYVDSDVAGWDCEITCLPDANGVRMYRFFQNDDKTG